MIFPANFGGDLVILEKAQIQIITDGSDPNTATILVNYLTAIISSYQQQLNPTQQLSIKSFPR